MKNKQLLFAAIGLLGFVAAQAQTGLTLGLRSGVTVSSVSTFPDDQSIYFPNEPKIGFVGGLTAGTTFSPKWGGRVEANFVRKGAYVQNPGLTKDQRRMNLDYIAVPLVASYYVTPKLSVEAGAEVAFRLKQQKIFFINVPFDYNNIDISGLMGVDWKVSKKWHLGTRYTVGVTPLFTLDITDVNGMNVGVVRQRNIMGELYVRYDIFGFKI